jgi:catechol 2,3-dioxygenase-like lactoylglutathione lyase family enzyme
MRVSIVICQVSEMERSVAFYRDILGLKPGNVSSYWTDFDAGGVEIGLHPPFAGPKAEFQTPRGGWILGVEVDDLKSLRAKLAGAAVTTGDYHDIPGGVVFDFQDPDGYPIQAVQHGVSSAQL